MDLPLFSVSLREEKRFRQGLENSEVGTSQRLCVALCSHSNFLPELVELLHKCKIHKSWLFIFCHCDKISKIFKCLGGRKSWHKRMVEENVHLMVVRKKERENLGEG